MGNDWNQYNRPRYAWKQLMSVCMDFAKKKKKCKPIGFSFHFESASVLLRDVFKCGFQSVQGVHPGRKIIQMCIYT